MFIHRKLMSMLSSLIVVFSLTFSAFQPVSASAQGEDGIKREVNTESGRVSFIGPESGRVLAASEVLGTFLRPQDPAMALAKRFGPEFGLKNPASELSEMKSSLPGDGRLTVRYQQNYQGIPVIGGELIVNTNQNGDLYSMNGEVSPNISLQTQPSIDSAQASVSALQSVAKWYEKTPADFVASKPELWIFDESLLQPSARPAELVWRMEVTSVDDSIAVRELVLVNAQQGGISLHFNQIDTEWTSARSEPIPQNQDDTPTETPIPTETPVPTETPIPTEISPSSSESDVVALAVTLYVDASDGNDADTCLTADLACATINSAIGKAAASGDTIKVATGTYTGTGAEVVLINKSVTISGGWNTSFTTQSGNSIIDGQGTRRGVYIDRGTTSSCNSLTSILDRFIIKNGLASGGLGGGIANTGNLTLTNSSIYNNSASAGGGIGNSYGCSVTLGNVTLSNNSASHGGGIWNDDGIVNLNNTTITSNSATAGAGIYTANGTSYLKNTIIAGNVGDDCGSHFGDYNYATQGYNLIGNNNNCAFVPTTGDKVGTNSYPIDPHLASIEGSTYTHALMIGSSAINAGNPSTPGSGGNACLAADQRGATRVGTCDMGAYEYNTPGVSILGDVQQSAILNNVLSKPLKVLVIDNSNNAVSNAVVTFTAPSSGPSGTFVNTGTFVTTAITNIGGVATATTFIANNLVGAYSVIPSTSGLPTLGNFGLNNVPEIIKTYTAYSTSTLPGTFLCDQTSPNCTNGSNLHADAAHKYAIGTYNLYLAQFNRDSIDNNGMIITSTVQYCDPGECPFTNAFWDDQMVYGEGYSLADDVVAHELTHGVTEYESNLFYYYQSGAINESFSDVFGEYYDQTNGLGNDTAGVKWLHGEDLPGGANRNMSNPPAFSDPDKMTSANYYKDFGDSGGVHTNSGVNNKAAYLMVDGGTFNGKTVTSLGWVKTAAIYYEAQTNLLSSGADYSDLYYALQQACTNLIGQKGITSGDCLEVKDAVDAVEMNLQPVADFNTNIPACDVAGQHPVNSFYDDLEAGSTNWVHGATTSTDRWTYDSTYGSYAHSGLHFFYADDYPDIPADTYLRMTNGVTVPPNGKLLFHHAYALETGYDGGVIEYSTNAGSSWTDAGSLIDWNGYDATLSTISGNPLGGRQAFNGISHGYISTRLNLSSLAGQNVMFRFRMGLDESVYYGGWWLDDIQVYNCVSHTISGNVGVEGVTLSYTDGTAKTVTSLADGSYSLPVSNNWSGTVTPSHSCFTFNPTSRTYSNVTTNQTSQNYTPTLNPASGCANIHINIGGALQGSYALLPGQSKKVTYNLDSGPVKIESTNGTPIVAALRDGLLVNGSLTTFSQLMGLPNEQLSDTYWFPTYVNNSTLNGQLRFGNVGVADTTVTVTIGGVDRGIYLLHPNEMKKVTYNLDAGPVKVQSSGGVPIVAALRDALVVNGGLSTFSQMMGIPDEQLSDTYWFPAYVNNSTLNGQLRFANVGVADTTVTVTIGGVNRGSYLLHPNEMKKVDYPLDAGPVKVTSSGGVPIVAALRDALLVNGSLSTFSQLMGIPDEGLSDTYWIPAYVNNSVLNGQLRFGNVGLADTTVTVTIGGVDRGSYLLHPNENKKVVYDLDSGPVKITSTGAVPIVAALRDALLVNGSLSTFSQLMGLPDEQLSDTYWLPAYVNNTVLNGQLRFGVP